MDAEHSHSGPHGGGSWGDMAAELVADADLLSPLRDQALAMLARLLADRAVEKVLDFGCGPGVTTVALAQAFPDANVTAADGSPELLDLVSSRAGAAGVGDRVSVECVDLDQDLRELGSFDVVWASMVLHHLLDLDRGLRLLAEQIRPGGWLAVTEFGGPLTLLPSSDDLVRSGVWGRFTEATHHALGHHLPNGHIEDWPERLDRAGFAVVSDRELFLDLPAPLGERQRNWLVHRISRERNSVADRLGGDDLAAIDGLLDSIPSRPDLGIRVSRMTFAARRLGQGAG